MKYRLLKFIIAVLALVVIGLLAAPWYISDPDIEKAMEPLFTTCPEGERSGMGFSFMEAFMDSLQVISAPDQGTTIRMEKKIGAGEDNGNG